MSSLNPIALKDYYLDYTYEKKKNKFEFYNVNMETNFLLEKCNKIRLKIIKKKQQHRYNKHFGIDNFANFRLNEQTLYKHSISSIISEKQLFISYLNNLISERKKKIYKGIIDILMYS